MSERHLKQVLEPADLPPLPIGMEDDMEPPPDHAGFLEARAAGFRAIRQQLAKRRKKK
jgi:hypothetical protein